ncbi:MULTISPECIES: hypothetical protein [Sphingomonas]|uniref:hypothetical protein n=1 Tax=Sphingomonas TaxID=13687 RepID=UPI000DEEE933|nr:MULTISPECIES: hypothetical protein [Sphingomonas]
MEKDTSNFLLGEIKATVTGTSEDVKALRVEVGDVARRVTATEQDLASLRAERSPMVEGYKKFEHKVNNHMQADAAWKAAHEAEQATERRQQIRTQAIMSMVIAIVASILTLVGKAYFG